MLALAFTAGCQNTEGIPIEFVPYERPDDFILEVWEGLKTANNGRPYEIKVNDSFNQFHLCFDGNGFRYSSRMTYSDRMPYDVEGRWSRIKQSGELYGNPYKREEGDILARLLRDKAVRITLFTAYEHRAELIPDVCTL